MIAWRRLGDCDCPIDRPRSDLHLPTNKTPTTTKKKQKHTQFFTAGDPEVRCWTIPAGTLAPQAAGAIHTDFERGFIKAEVGKKRGVWMEGWMGCGGCGGIRGRIEPGCVWAVGLVLTAFRL